MRERVTIEFGPIGSDAKLVYYRKGNSVIIREIESSQVKAGETILASNKNVKYSGREFELKFNDKISVGEFIDQMAMVLVHLNFAAQGKNIPMDAMVDVKISLTENK